MENDSDVTSRTLVERFPIGRAVTTTNIIVGSTRNGIVIGHFVGATGEFVLVGMGKAQQVLALQPDYLRRADVQHPRCPSCECEKTPVPPLPPPPARVRTPQLLDEDWEDD